MNTENLDKSEKRNHNSVESWLRRAMNVVPSAIYTGNESKYPTIGSGQESVGEGGQEKYETEGQLSVEDRAKKSNSSAAAGQVTHLAQGDAENQATTGYGVQGFAKDYTLQSEAIGTEPNSNLYITRNDEQSEEQEAEESDTRSAITQQAYRPTTQLSSTKEDNSLNYGQALTSAYDEVPSWTAYGQNTVRDLAGDGINYQAVSAQRRGEAAKPSNATTNATANVEEQQEITKTQSSQLNDENSTEKTTSGTSSKYLPTSAQQVSTSQINVTTNAQKFSTQQNEQGWAFANDGSTGNMTQAVNESIQPTIAATTTASMSAGTLASTSAVTSGKVSMDSVSASPTSKVIAEMKTTDRGNASNAGTSIPVTGSVILTEKVSYMDLKNDSDEEEQETRKATEVVPKGPSIFFTTNNEVLNGAETLAGQRSLDGVGNQKDTARAVEENKGTSFSDATLPNEGESQSSFGPASESQGSGVQRSEVNAQSSDVIQNQGVQSINGETPSIDRQMLGYSEAHNDVKTNEYNGERANVDYSQEVGNENVAPSLRLQIPSNKQTQTMVDSYQKDRMNSNSVKWEGNGEQGSGEAKTREIRTLPATLVPPLTSPLIEEKLNVEPSYTANAHPTEKIEAVARYVTTKSASTTSTATGDMMTLNNELGIEMVESGDHLGSPPEVAAQHIFTPRVPDTLATNESANSTLHKIFSDIVSDELLGNDTEVNATNADLKEKEYGNQDAEDSKEDTSDEKIEDLKLQNDNSANQKVDSLGDKKIGKAELAITSETRDQQVGSTDKPGENKLETKNVNTITVIEQAENNTEPSTQSVGQELESKDQSEPTDQSLQTLKQDSVSGEQSSPQPEKELSAATASDDESMNQGQILIDRPTNKPTDHSTKTQDQSAITDANEMPMSQEYTVNALKPAIEASEKASQRDEVDAAEYREPNIDENDDEFELPKFSTEAINQHLEEMLLNPENLPPETVAEDIEDEGENLIEANDLVVHDDLDR